MKYNRDDLKHQKISRKKGFSLIEILVVVTIIGFLAVTASVSYSQFLKQSRDARRKADVENIRAALEMYRSNTSVGSYPDNINDLVTGSYINSLPTDPKSGLSYLTYVPSPAGCNEVTACTNYTLSATLETGGIYQTNAYGGSVVAPTNTPTPSPTP